MFIRNLVDWARGRSAVVAAGQSTMREAAEYMARRAAELAPKDTHFLSRSIIVQSSKSGAIFHVLAMADYAQWVEFGHYSVAGTWVAPQPFMRNALADTARKFPEFAAGTRLQRPDANAGRMHLGATFTATT